MGHLASSKPLRRRIDGPLSSRSVLAPNLPDYKIKHYIISFPKQALKTYFSFISQVTLGPTVAKTKIFVNPSFANTETEKWCLESRAGTDRDNN